MTTEEETWEQKEEPGGGGGGGGQGEQGAGGAVEEGAPKEEEEMMEEEEEEVPVPKITPIMPDAPKKEHVNVVFIGHVGASGGLVFKFNLKNMIDSFIQQNLLSLYQMLENQPLEGRSCESLFLFNQVLSLF